MNSRILEGDAGECLRELPDGVFRCCITSPPYWGLRDYGVTNQIGAEDDLDQYLDRLSHVFSEIRRVLTDDGTLWLNMGDGYTSGNRTRRATDKKNQAREMGYRAPTPAGLKPKDLLGVPWRIAFRLQADGWFLRSDIIWNKPNAQPESVKDRPTRSHEYVFLFSKSERYYYDYSESLEPAAQNGKSNGQTRNRRSVWSINTEPFPEAHFATFPLALVVPCMLIGSQPGDSVIDPFSGSGTVGVVAQELNRKFVGIELNQDYVNLAERRLRTRGAYVLETNTSQPRLLEQVQRFKP